MKSIIRKAVSVSAAAIMVSAFAMEAGAAKVTETKTEEYQFNKPYLNINVDGGDIDFNDVSFTLKNSDGQAVAKWNGGADKFSEVSEGLYDVSDIADYTASDYAKLPWDKFDKDGLTSKYKNGSFYSNYDPDSGIHYMFTSDKIYPTDKCSYLYFDIEKYRTGVVRIVPANSIELVVTNDYKTNGDNYSGFRLYTQMDSDFNSSLVIDDTTFSDYAGSSKTFSVPEGKYRFFVGIGGGGSNAGGVHATSYAEGRSYSQLKLNIKDLISDYYMNDNYEFVKKNDSNENVLFPSRGDKSGENKVAYAFLNGSVISASNPDSEGNVSIWINEDDPKIQLQTDFSSPSGMGGGWGDTSLSTPKTQLNITAKFEIPESGLTLYDIPAGDYTVEVDSAEYTLENNTIKVTDTKDLQSMNVVLKKAEEPSSSEASSSEASSSEASSSEASSSEASSSEASSSEASSSEASSETSSFETSSSEVTSSDDTSSVTESKTSSASSKPSSSSKAANNSNTANPSTGAAAGLTGIALIAGAAVVVSKKNRK